MQNLLELKLYVISLYHPLQVTKRPLNEAAKDGDVVDKPVTTIVRKTEKAVNFAHPKGTKSSSFELKTPLMLAFAILDELILLFFPHRLFPYKTCTQAYY